MAKTNNKGFSLIEIVIAVAILSILLTPIIHQFANTLNTSRRAKALQEANEKASYQMEEFQTVSRDELDDPGYYGTPVTKTDNTAELYKTDGTSLSKSVTYTTYTYTLPDCEIGAKKDKYSNVVVLDDLANKVRAQGNAGDPTHYKIAYGLTKTDLEKFGDDFELTNEGSIVKYDTNGVVTAVACTDTTTDGIAVSYIADPNEVNLGNMHDLDKNSVAMIMGGTSSFDTEAFSALFSKAMDHLRELDYDSWEQALLNVDSESILSTDTLSSSDRLIKIYTDEKTDAKGKYYVVKVDVYYNYSYSIQVNDLDADKQAQNNFNDTVTYTIFSQNFRTAEAPEIYFEYQPYCISEKGEAVKYKADDYFLFDNHVDGCKLYLYKPYRDQMNANADLADYDSKGEFYTYYTAKGSTNKVKIHLASKVANAPVTLGADGKPAATNAYDRVYIYTNLNVDGYETGTTSDNIQFVSDDYSDKFKYVKGEYETQQGTLEDTGSTYAKYPLGTTYVVNQIDETGVSKQVPSDELNPRLLYKLSEEVKKSNRLYTVTVTMTPLNNKALNTIQLSGARGVN